MKKIRNIFSVIAVILIVIYLLDINYDNLSWIENKSEYLGIISMSLILFSMVFSNRAEKKIK